MKKRLLMISGLGGVEALVSGKQGAFYHTLEEFHAYWERVDIISPKVKGLKQGTQVFFGNVYVHVSSWPLIFHPVFFLKKGAELWKQHRFDLMTVHEFPPFYNGIGARILHSLTGVPYILEIMHIPGVPRAGSFKERFYKWLMRLLIAYDVRPARAVRIINQRQTKDFLLRAGVPARKLLYIPAFYIDLDVFKPLETEKKYDLVYAARLERNKGIIDLVQAVKILKETKDDISLLIIGNGPLRKSIETYVSENGLQKNIELSGWLQSPEDVANAYRSARVFLNPSLNEGGPRVVLEAMACGLPVITTRVGIMLDVIEDGKNGIFCDWNPQDMASKANSLLKDRVAQERYVMTGPILAQRFEKKKAVRDYAETLKSLSVGRERDLLVITQKVDMKDDLLGFFQDWLNEFSKHFDNIFVITLAKGVYDLPSNVHVYSLGKERASSRVVRILRFYALLFRFMPRVSGVFAHMSPVFAIAAWPAAVLRGKKIVLWYLHRSVTLKLKIAEKICFKIVTAARESLQFDSGKIIETGHGIRTELYKTDRDWNLPEMNILSVGRISQIKNLETLLEAAKILKTRGYVPKITIAGRPVMSPDLEYLERLKSLKDTLDLGSMVEFIGFISHDRIPELYKLSQIVIGLTPRGGVDKTLLEGMASGCLTLTSNDVCAKYFGENASRLIFTYRDPENLANKIEDILKLSPEEKTAISDHLSVSVQRHHDLKNLATAITRLY